MSIKGMSVQALAGEIVKAVVADEAGDGCDISAGLFGTNFSDLIKKIVYEYLQPQPVAQGDTVARLECPGITSWNSFCKNCKAPAHVCFDTNCNGSGSTYEAVGNVTHKCKCVLTIPTGHRVVSVDDVPQIAKVTSARFGKANLDLDISYFGKHMVCEGDTVELRVVKKSEAMLAAAPDAGGV